MAAMADREREFYSEEETEASEHSPNSTRGSMAEVKHEFPIITDPHTVPVTFVNQVVAAGHLNGVVNLTLATARWSPKPDGKVDIDMVTASRLRMDLVCAVQLRAQLDRIIGEAEATVKQMLATAIVSTAAVGKSGKSN